MTAPTKEPTREEAHAMELTTETKLRRAVGRVLCVVGFHDWQFKGCDTEWLHFHPCWRYCGAISCYPCGTSDEAVALRNPRKLHPTPTSSAGEA